MNPTTTVSPFDSTVGEIHRTRERISDTFGGDIHAISEAARRRQEQSQRHTVSYADASKDAVKR